jgi:hypothetical protein
MPPAPAPTTVKDIATRLQRDYRDAIRLSAREEILADLAEDPATARLHAYTARFHHGSAHAYARAVELLLRFRGEEEELDLDLHEDKQRARLATREADLAPMRCQGRPYRSFEADRP